MRELHTGELAEIFGDESNNDSEIMAVMPELKAAYKEVVENNGKTKIYDILEEGDKNDNHHTAQVWHFVDANTEAVMVYEWAALRNTPTGEYIREQRGQNAELPIGYTKKRAKLVFNKRTNMVYFIGYHRGKKYVCNMTNCHGEYLASMLGLGYGVPVSVNGRIASITSKWDNIEKNYPVLRGIDTGCQKIQSWITKHARRVTSLKELARKCLGSGSKSVTRLMTSIINYGYQPDQGRLEYTATFATLFKRVVKQDINLAIHNVDTLKEYSTEGNPEYCLELFELIVKQYDLKTALRIFTVNRKERKIVATPLVGDGFRGSSYTRDALVMWGNISDEAKVRPQILESLTWKRRANLKEIHDMLTRVARSIGRNTYVFGKQQRPVSKLNGKEVEGFTYFIPTSTEDLLDVGDELHICVGSASYDRYTYKGTIHIITLRNEEGYKYCIEVNRKGELIQFKGMSNSHVNRSPFRKKVANQIRNAVNSYDKDAEYDGVWSESSVTPYDPDRFISHQPELPEPQELPF
jgi:hypothetical protein